MALNLDYYYGSEAEQYSFYRIPKLLFTDPTFFTLEIEAKVLYGMMLDRMSLSIRNNWLDSLGRVYIYFTLDDALDILRLGRNKVIRLFKELEDIGLIDRKKQGQGKPAMIYVKNFISPETSHKTKKPIGPPEKSEKAEPVSTHEMDYHSCNLHTPFQKPQSVRSEPPAAEGAAVSIPEVQKSQNGMSACSKSEIHEVSKTNPNNTELFTQRFLSSNYVGLCLIFSAFPCIIVV